MRNHSYTDSHPRVRRSLAERQAVLLTLAARIFFFLAALFVGVAIGAQKTSYAIAAVAIVLAGLALESASRMLLRKRSRGRRGRHRKPIFGAPDTTRDAVAPLDSGSHPIVDTNTQVHCLEVIEEPTATAPITDSYLAPAESGTAAGVVLAPLATGEIPTVAPVTPAPVAVSDEPKTPANPQDVVSESTHKTSTAHSGAIDLPDELVAEPAPVTEEPKQPRRSPDASIIATFGVPYSLLVTPVTSAPRVSAGLNRMNADSTVPARFMFNVHLAKPGVPSVRSSNTAAPAVSGGRVLYNAWYSVPCSLSAARTALGDRVQAEAAHVHQGPVTLQHLYTELTRLVHTLDGIPAVPPAAQTQAPAQAVIDLTAADHTTPVTKKLD